MLPERTVVSRKTPKDGKLEIARATAEALARGGSDVTVFIDGQSARGVVTSMPCECRGGSDRHLHYFLQSDLLKALAVGREVTVDGGGQPATVNVR